VAGTKRPAAGELAACFSRREGAARADWPVIGQRDATKQKYGRAEVTALTGVRALRLAGERKK